MCGIVAYSGGRDGAALIIDGLKKLEYRGYDSAGVAYSAGGKINILKAVGKVNNLEELVLKNKVNSRCLIGHTRWATHGKPSRENSHPHTGQPGDVALVHNGIIENYLELKQKLIAKGHKFKSQTDSEVAAHLIEENLKKNMAFPAAFEAAVKQLKGAYALVAVYKGEQGVLMAAKKQSPLVLGIGEGEYFLASDVPAFLQHTKKAVFMEDGDIACISPRGYKITAADGRPAKRKINTITWDNTSAQKGGYKHFMLKEIFDQPQAVEDTLRTLPKDIKKSFGISTERAKKIKGLYLIACGTAYHAALAAKYFLEHFAKLPVEVDTASEFKYRDVNFQKDWLFCAVSQSGETADTIAALLNAKKAGLRTLGVCNVLGSAITRMSDFTVYTRCGPEISVASTKAFTSQLTVLYALALQLGFARGALPRPRFNELYKELLRLPALFAAALKTQEQVKKTARRIYRKKSFIFLGRNACYPLALEGALKLKEISYLHAEGFPAGEIKHGPIAVIERGTPVFALAPQGFLEEKMISSCQIVCARGAMLILITNDAAQKGLMLPRVSEYLFPIIAAAPLQLFAYYIAAFNGREIDRPRNLAKSVTVE
ncbi:MAG: glutamine--fructose-6-phosphate transaminase (isomerizing) [Elusimicrobiota bacterium]|jgi:glucosamine--fructose-6-phosphate aminotransferase (isomerizing)|nr:glutamine--fructose-6-phosphate transaminase (isomerizing) [Elusimicrobiota bacterium]